ncbi:hypothetical protein GAH_00922 [Geoglobus ahangari]|uniref:Uncharacterized protein n=1 Tax=Geoglobus ahangari TaxID=113653 RepID=A0A0F7IIE1_9EURY|nr:hypothetical protein [Geoglobus ahangari]AKG91750.1 hypothetical protein GAH_00922 [Geoglobus ahangari]
MSRKLLILVITLLTLIGISHAAQTVTKDNYAEPVIEPKLKDYYLPGESLSVNMTIEPKTSDDAEIIDGRVYEFNTSLDDPSMLVTVEYAGFGGGGIVTPGKDYVKVDVKDWEGGLSRIVVEVSGKVPEVSQRIARIVVIGVDIQDAEGDAISPVVINVVNTALFSEYISSLEKRYDNLSAKATELESKGVAVADIIVKLNSAKTRIDDGKTYFNEGKYGEANTSLAQAEEYLNEAENLIRKTEVELLIETAKDKLDIMFNKMTELELLIQKLKSKDKSTLNYEVKLEEFKQSYSEIAKKISQAEDYLNNGLYDDAENTVNDAIKQIDERTSEINSLIDEVAPQVEETPTPQETETPQGPGIGERVSEFFSGIASWLSENRDRILLYGGGVVVLALLGFVGYRGVKAYMRRRKWDELK